MTKENQVQQNEQAASMEAPNLDPINQHRIRYTNFTPEMKSTHTLLFPQMSPIHFGMMADILRRDGYTVEVLENEGAEVVANGLQYVHNDSCYPALLVIGQFIDALKSGKYDLTKIALLITQTGGGCRASNYIFLLRKALMRAGLENIPVASLNFSGLEDSLPLPMSVYTAMIDALIYGDALMCLSNQLRPYEDKKGEVDELVKTWTNKLGKEFLAGKLKMRHQKGNLRRIAEDFGKIKVTRIPRKRVGIVGEIYVKFSPIGNNGLEEFLAEEGCEVNMPGLLGFVQYCIFNMLHDIELYGGSRIRLWVLRRVLGFSARRERAMIKAISAQGLRAPAEFATLIKLTDGVIGLGAKMGEGWLLTAEMAELVEAGFSNIVCAQPFGCLPNHIVGKGMIAKLRSKYPNANIVPIDYDPSATKVNQINRIKLMLTSAE